MPILLAAVAEIRAEISGKALCGDRGLLRQSDAAVRRRATNVADAELADDLPYARWPDIGPNVKRKEFQMENTDFRLVQQIFESQLREATSVRTAGESIRIHQAADPVDMTQEAAERELAGRILDRESAVVRHLRSALARIKHGSYGICLECDEEIAPTRLKAVPWAERCIGCQERAENIENQPERIRPQDRKEAA